VTVTVSGVRVMRAGMVMMPRIGDVAGDGKGRGDRGAGQQAVTKPRNPPIPLLTPSLNLRPPRRRPLTVYCSGTVLGVQSAEFPLPARRRTKPRYPNNTVKQVRKTRLRNG